MNYLRRIRLLAVVFLAIFADVIARASETDLANIIYIFGEERHSRGVARAIVLFASDPHRNQIGDLFHFYLALGQRLVRIGVRQRMGVGGC